MKGRRWQVVVRACSGVVLLVDRMEGFMRASGSGCNYTSHWPRIGLSICVERK